MKSEKLLAGFQSAVYFPEILKVKKSFEVNKIDFLFLKGLPLHLYFEKSPPGRILADCDVLIAKKDGLKAGKIFKRLGYELTETAYSKLHHRLKDKLTEVTYFKVVNNCLVAFDVHFEVVFLMNQLGKLDALYPQRLVDEMTQQFLKQKRKVKIKGGLFPVLSPSNLIIYLSLHFFHHNFKGVHRLKFLNKIVCYYRKNMTNELGEEIVDRVKYYQLQNFVYPGFVMLNARLGLVFPQRIIDRIKPDRSVLKYIDKLIRHQNIIDREDQLAAGINRFKNIFYLSPRPLRRKILIFLNPAVIYSFIWSIAKKLQFARAILRLMGNKIRTILLYPG